MSTRIRLRFDAAPYPKLASLGIAGDVIRLVARASFRMGDRWSPVSEGWIDTGAPFSLLPERIWKPLSLSVLARGLAVSVTGLTIPADVGTVDATIMDESGWFTVSPLRAFLCHSDRVPILLGMTDFLTRSVLHCDYPSRSAYMEFV